MALENLDPFGTLLLPSFIHLDFINLINIKMTREENPITWEEFDTKMGEIEGNVHNLSCDKQDVTSQLVAITSQLT